MAITLTALQRDVIVRLRHLGLRQLAAEAEYHWSRGERSARYYLGEDYELLKDFAQANLEADAIDRSLRM